MSKYKFSLAERFAIYKILGPRCIWCTEPMPFRDMNADHIIPETTEKDTLEEIIEYYRLSDDFSLNSFYNWGPMHQKCNRDKSNGVFERAPFIGAILQKIKNKVPELKKAHEIYLKEFSTPITIAHLEQTLVDNKLNKEEVFVLLNKISPPPKDNAAEFIQIYNCFLKPFCESEEQGEKTPKQFTEVYFKQFNSNEKDLLALNDFIRADAMNQLIAGRDNYYNFLIDMPYDEYYSDVNSTHSYWMDFSLMTKTIISYTSTVRFYNTGAAHEQYAISGHSYLLSPLRSFSLSTFLTDFNGFISKVSPLIYSKLVDEVKSIDPTEEVTDDYPINKEWLATEFSAFNNYHFTKNSLAFIFNPYEIAPWSYGALFPEITFEELIPLFPTETKLIELISSIRNETV